MRKTKQASFQAALLTLLGILIIESGSVNLFFGAFTMFLAIVILAAMIEELEASR